ncbi:MAG: hypothetical protein CMP10_18950 [Zetaproteobacteria bacterium]|nr:hypothetical protein [Pseudobdellovibrionaceae bacterium]
MKTKSIDRRMFLQQILSAYSCLGLRSFLLGVSPAFLSQRLMADSGERQFLIFSSDVQGSPLNCNVPGAYMNGIDHPTQAAMAPTNFQLGNVNVRAAAPWALLPRQMLSRLHFIHNRTQINAHTEFNDVMYGLGRIKSESGAGAEMIASVVAQENYKTLGTVMEKPIVLDSRLEFKGNQINSVTPRLFQSLFSGQGRTQVTQMMKFRDQAIDTLYADLKEKGTPAQKDFLESAIKSRSQARALSEKLINDLSDLPSDDTEAAILVAAVVCAAGVSPVANIRLGFGSDNHADANLDDEVSETLASIANLSLLQTHLTDFGISDRVTFAIQNAFGRTLRRNAKGGRDHNSQHNVTVVFGPKVKPGVSGGIETVNGANGGRALAFNSQTGRPADNGDITPATSLISSVKTIYKACGLPDEVIEKRAQGGKVIKAALI